MYFKPFLLLCFLCFPLLATVKAPPKNIIYFIGDGMGPGYLSAYRYYKNPLSEQTLVPTLFDQHLVGMASTRPHDETWVTDSAAAATALSTGTKTYNGAVAISPSKTPLTTLFEVAKQQGKKTGLAVTSSVTHATPASFYAHQLHRKQAPEIANQLVDNQRNGRPVVDVILGGGLTYFQRTDRQLLTELQQTHHYHLVTALTALADVKQTPLIGLFADNGLPAALNTNKQRLATMTRTAIRLLQSHNEGFVLLVEGSQIDWCGHDNDIACAMAEMEDFENAFAVALNFAQKRTDTLIVLTADHDTGGLSVGANKDYLWHSDKIANINVTARQFTKLANEVTLENHHKNLTSLWQTHLNIEYSKDQWQALRRLHQKMLEMKKSFALGETDKQIVHLSQQAFTEQVKQIINVQTNTGWTSTGHTGNDVAVMAFGPEAKQFSGYQQNSDIAKKLHKLVLNQTE